MTSLRHGGILFANHLQNLVWSGFGAAGPGISHAPQVCNYKNEPHLCFYQGTQMVGWGHGHGVIMDKHYRIVKSVEPGSYQASSDMHEFSLLPDGKSALMTQYLRSVHDLCIFGICNGLGYINQGAFQEVEVETGKVLFEWRSLDHIDPSESYVGPSTTEISGTGEEPESPWDYFHINSIDKNDAGDYLVSARHTSAIYKISGKDGNVIWRLNGAKSDFRLVDCHFSFQHDARFVSDTEDETIISIFDNGTNGFNQTQAWSTALLVRINHRDKTARVVRRYDPPVLEGSRHIAKSQGNFQRLPGGNFVLGWGNNAYWSEHLDDGTTVFHCSIGLENVMNYRAYKFDNWVGLPLTKPALWTYSRTGHGDEEGMMLYVSWNGATEVRRWAFYASEIRGGPWVETASTPKNGFETILRLDQFSRYVYADALDRDGNVLGTSEIQETFVPSKALLPYCDDLACKFVPNNDELRQQKLEAAMKRIEEEQNQKSAQEHRRKVVEGAMSGLGGLIALTLVLFLTRGFISKPFARLRLVVADAIAGQDKGRYTALELNG
jgi:hypothetical protein